MITTTKQKQINIKAEIYDHKFLEAKQQTEQYCTPEIAAELEADGFMIGKPFPYDDSLLDLEQAEQQNLPPYVDTSQKCIVLLVQRQGNQV